MKACCSRCDREFDTTAELDVHFGLFHTQQPAVPMNDAVSMVLPNITHDEKQSVEVFYFFLLHILVYAIYWMVYRSWL